MDAERDTTRRIPMSAKRFLARLAPLALTAGVAAGAMSATPAHAVVVDTDRPHITESGFDFGLHWDTIAAPVYGGHLYWDVTDGNVTPRLTGNLYLKHVATVCAWMHVDYRDSSNHVLASKDGTHHCADSNAKQQWSIDLSPYSSPYITNVRISIEHDNTNGSVSKLGQQTWYLG
jgi:hypothetical protein